MVSYDLVRLDSSDSQLRSWRMEVTLVVRSYWLVTYLAALRCTASNFLVLSTEWGFHTEEQYSKWGRTKEM
jgi:hypothetical protein